MSEPPRDREPVNPQVWMAAERTLLAWVRTGLATMGLGFVVARFALFLDEIRARARSRPGSMKSPSSSAWRSSSSASRSAWSPRSSTRGS